MSNTLIRCKSCIEKEHSTLVYQLYIKFVHLMVNTHVYMYIYMYIHIYIL